MCTIYLHGRCADRNFIMNFFIEVNRFTEYSVLGPIEHIFVPLKKKLSFRDGNPLLKYTILNNMFL